MLKGKMSYSHTQTQILVHIKRERTTYLLHNLLYWWLNNRQLDIFLFIYSYFLFVCCLCGCSIRSPICYMLSETSNGWKGELMSINLVGCVGSGNKKKECEKWAKEEFLSYLWFRTDSSWFEAYKQNFFFFIKKWFDKKLSS